ncbi:MAG TPA: sigma factor-like helix-turn-helix DNA-binding protein [Myxococcaceae bacterium]|nr:sigma factor-like helix-turn-helix DNA-binding protein [Myxococcaceae bacterium]
MRAPADELARRLLARRAGDLDATATALGEALAAVDHAHPEWPILPSDFVDALADRLPPGPPDRALAQLRALDLYQALAAAKGHAPALAALEREAMPKVRAALGRLGASASDIDDAAQRLRAHALVPEGLRPARISGYAGLGPLSAWLSVVAARLFLHESRRRTPFPGPPGDDALEVLFDSPEMEAYRREGRPAVKAAFQRAVASLQKRHRTLLRMSVVDGLNGEEIGAVYGVNRSSVARWLQQCREELGEAMRRELGEAGLDSLIGDLVSQLDLSLDRVLKSDGSFRQG